MTAIGQGVTLMLGLSIHATPWLHCCALIIIVGEWVIGLLLIPQLRDAASAVPSSRLLGSG